jgi:glycosyltransferase involved in cell wall biosynthesis
MKLLVLSYAFSPFKGSEFSVAWNYACHMGRENELDIIIGLTDDHMGKLDSLNIIRDVISSKGLRVNLHPVYPSFLARAVNHFNVIGLFPYAFYVAYRLWHRKAYNLAKVLVAHRAYDLVHYQNPIGYREPGYLWRLDLPYIWGPIGGLNSYEAGLYDALRSKGKVDYFLRSISNYLNFLFNTRLRKAINRSDLLLINNSKDKATFDKWFKKNTVIFSESWCSAEFVRASKSNDKLRFLWVGTLNQRKGLFFFLNVLIRNDFDINLVVVGDGSEKEFLEKFTLDNEICGVVFKGRLTREQVQEEFQVSDFSLYTSLMDANPSVIWESLSNGCPIVGLGIDGFLDNTDERFALKVKVSDFESTVNSFADVITRIVENRAEIEDWFDSNIYDAYMDKHWNRRVDDWLSFYKTAIRNFNER